ncbi:MAG: S-layer homology domain-containing protein [Clostridia bacterium]|nr:S-layer homology domain-containing protein [Clostridia bacterium]
MKKLFIMLTISLIMTIGLGTVSFAKETKPIELIEVSGLDTPYSKGEILDTTVNLTRSSYSYFEELSWSKTAEGLHKVEIRLRAHYHDYHYDENTKATLNGNPVHEIKVDEDNKYYVTLTYVFPEEEVNANLSTSSTLLHTITVMYMKNGRISPNPIRAPHRKNFTVQIIPDEGYEVKDVVVDGESVGAVTEYTFRRVETTHKIKAYFKPIEGYVPSEDEEDVESGDAEVVEPDTKVFEFDDVKENDWYYDEVQYVCNAGIFNGTSETTFGPEETATREQLVTVLYRYAKSKNVDVSVGENTNILSYDDAFDISEYAVEAFQWACGAGIINGTTASTLAPKELVTREQLVTILYRYAKNVGVDVSVGEDTNILSYDDALNVSEYAVEAFQWACGSKVITGKTASTLAPQEFVTRAEYATIVMRFDEAK